MQEGTEGVKASPGAGSDDQKGSYAAVAKSSLLLGGAAATNILLGLIRAKVLAVRLGPGVFGLMGLYSSLISMYSTIAAWGMTQALVREIAASVGEGDQDRVAFLVRLAKRIVLVTGLVALCVVFLLRSVISEASLGTKANEWDIAVLGLCILFGHLQSGHTIVLSGLRKIRDLALINVIGAVWATVIAIPVLLYLGKNGVAGFLLAAAVGSYIVSFLFASRVPVGVSTKPGYHVWKEVATVFRVGGPIMFASLVPAVTIFLNQMILKEYYGETGVGLYQSALNICSVGVGFILNAMAGDYLPRLSAASHDLPLRNRLVNEQCEMGVLLAVPSLVLVIAFSGLIIPLLYSGDFSQAQPILRWQSLGLFGRVVGWSLGFIPVARGASRVVLLTELATCAFHVGCMKILVEKFGIQGAGGAFAIQYVFYFVLMSLVVKRWFGFEVRMKTVRLLVAGLALCVLACCVAVFEDVAIQYALGVGIVFCALVWSWVGLKERLGIEPVSMLISKFRRVLSRR